MLKRMVRYVVDHGRFVQVISEQRCAKAPLEVGRRLRAV